VQRNSTRRAFLIFRSFSALMVCGLPVSGGVDTPLYGYGVQEPGAA
jgi:hypothetical protein